MADQPNRAYSRITVKSFDEELREIEGIATTPTADRMGDIVVAEGAKFELPIPLLWQHNSSQPVGHVTEAKVTKEGIAFKAKLVRVDTDGELKSLLDMAWQSVSSGLVRAVSIGFSALKHSVLKDGGYQFDEWSWLELSLVTIPANAEATITTIRSIDRSLRAASGAPQVSDARTTPGVTGTTKTEPTPGKTPKGKTMTITEQIASFEATKTLKLALMDDLMAKSAETGETLDDAQAEEYDTAETEVAKIDKHLARLARAEANSAANAKPVEGANTVKAAGEIRGGAVPATVRAKNLPKGTAFTRYAMCLAKAKGNTMQAAEMAERHCADTPEVANVLKAAVAAGTTTDAGWAAELVDYTNMASEFIELLRPMTIMGRISGLRRVPFNIKIPGASSGTSVNWVGEGKPKPVSSMVFNTTTLGHFKAAGIVVLTDELVKFSNPSAESLVRDDLTAAMAQFLDQQFLDPTKTETANVSPASITNGVTGVAATGASADALRADMRSLMAAFLAANLSMQSAVLVMSSTQALGISLLINPLGQPEFPTLTAEGGTLMGMPVVLSENVPTGQITMIKASEILFADDGEVLLDVSSEASIEMDSAPTGGTVADPPKLVSLWQNNMLGLRAERFVNWKRRRPDAVQMITGAAYQ